MSSAIEPPSCTALIPARGGSRRIPRKNIRVFCGKPIISWAIEAAKTAGCFSDVIVSTDDEEIASMARQFGAETPFVRPANISDAHTEIRDVWVHGINELAKLGRTPEYVCCICATAPFVRPEDLRAGLNMLMADPSAHFAYSVTRFPYHIQRALRIRQDGRLEMMQPEFLLARSQDMEDAYHDAAQFYWGRAASFLDRSKRIPSPDSLPVVLPGERVQDIDTPEDWRRAELMFLAMQGGEGRAS